MVVINANQIMKTINNDKGNNKNKFNKLEEKVNFVKIMIK